MTSLIVSFHGDGEAPTPSNGASALGSTEWRDLEPAIEYATSHGATSIALIAWSMGAQLALNYLARGKHRALVGELILIAPITSWNAALRHALRRAHLPAFPANITAWILRTPHLNQIAGIKAPIDLRELDWTTTRLETPTLIVHSQDDTQAPISASRRLAESNPDTVRLIERSDVDHALEYNADPTWFTRVIADWLGAR
jgi:pimeloyl-ACP methyl ester carboxylesterase